MGSIALFAYSKDDLVKAETLLKHHPLSSHHGIRNICKPARGDGFARMQLDGTLQYDNTRGETRYQADIIAYVRPDANTPEPELKAFYDKLTFFQQERPRLPIYELRPSDTHEKVIKVDVIKRPDEGKHRLEIWAERQRKREAEKTSSDRTAAR